MSITATVFESLKRVSENVTKVYQSGFAHGFAEIEKVVMDDVEVGLDNIIAIQEAILGGKIITFTFDVWGFRTKHTALEGMTWADWANSQYNNGFIFLDGEDAWLANGDGLCSSASEQTATDIIVDGETYYAC